LTIVFSSASLQYLSDEEIDRVGSVIGGASAPVAWVGMEPLRRQDDKGRFVLSLDGEILANVHYHGTWVEWLS
jgi:hypothetical protein